MLGYEVTPRQLNISIEQSESQIVGWSARASYRGSSQAEVEDTESTVGMNVTEAWTESVEDSQDGEGVTDWVIGTGLR